MGDPTDLRPFRHLCGEADLRDAMSDEDFWAHVFPQMEWEPTIEEEYEPAAGSPCDECGAPGACAYDQEGRPMVHAPGLDP